MHHRQGLEWHTALQERHVWEKLQGEEVGREESQSGPDEAEAKILESVSGERNGGFMTRRQGGEKRKSGESIGLRIR